MPDHTIEDESVHTAESLISSARSIGWENVADENLAGLPDQAAREGMLDTLLADVEALDHLDPDRLANAVAKHYLGRSRRPAVAGAILGTRERLTGITPEERAFVRSQLAPDGNAVLRSCGLRVRVVSRLARAPRWNVRIRAHNGSTNAVAFGTRPDGSTVLFSGGYDDRSSLRSWDPITGELTRSFSGEQPSLVDSLAIGNLPDGAALIATVGVGWKGEVAIWDPLTGRRTMVLEERSGVKACSAAFGSLPGGEVVLATGRSNGTIRLWDPRTGERIGRLLYGHSGLVRALEFGTLQDGATVLASAGSDGTIRLWDPVTHEQISSELRSATEWSRPGVEARSVAFGTLPDGATVLASAHADGTIRLWDPVTHNQIGEPLRGHTGRVNSLAFGALTDGTPILVSGGADKTIRLWNPATGDQISTPLFGHTDQVTSVACTTLTDGTSIVASAGGSWTMDDGDDSTVRLWDLSALDGNEGTDELSAGHSDEVESVSFGTLPDGTVILASASRDATVRVWDPATGDPINGPLRGHTGEVSSLSFSSLPDGRTILASAGRDATVRIWDPSTATQLGAPIVARRSRNGRSDWLTASAAGSLADGTRLLAFGGWDGFVDVYNPATGEKLSIGPDSDLSWAKSLAFTDLEGRATALAVGYSEGYVRVFDPVSGELVAPEIELDPEAICAIASGILPDGRSVLATLDEGFLGLWNPSTGDLVAESTESHAGWGSSLTFMALGDGRGVFVSAGYDATIRLWDPGTGEQLAVLPTVEHANCLAAHPSDPVLAVGIGSAVLILRLEDEAVA